MLLSSAKDVFLGFVKEKSPNEGRFPDTIVPEPTLN